MFISLISLCTKQPEPPTSSVHEEHLKTSGFFSPSFFSSHFFWHFPVHATLPQLKEVGHASLMPQDIAIWVRDSALSRKNIHETVRTHTLISCVLDLFFFVFTHEYDIKNKSVLQQAKLPNRAL